MIYSQIHQNRGLYAGIAFLSLVLILTASGGGLFGAEGLWMTDWQHKAFRMLCHQDPGRSFWINGKPMAVCARCYGIYGGFGLLWISIPLLKNISSLIQPFAKKFLLLSIFLNVVDVVGNLLGFWQNTALSRSIMGGIIGMASVLMLTGEFLNFKNQ